MKILFCRDLERIRLCKLKLEKNIRDKEKKARYRKCENAAGYKHLKLLTLQFSKSISFIDFRNESNRFEEENDNSSVSSANFPQDQSQYCSKHAINDLHQPIYEKRKEPDFKDILAARKYRDTVILNVGGEKHEVMWTVLKKQPRSRLGLLASATSADQILNLCDAFSLEENEYYFDRHPRTFNCILNFYRTGKLHVMMEDMCVMDFSQDLEFWMIEDIYLEACCESKYSIRKEHVSNEVKKNSKDRKIQSYYEDFGSSYCARYQECLWNLFEKPNSSVSAKVISLISVGLVLLSTVAMCLNTMPEFKLADANGDKTLENPWFALTEAVCISWFTVEYLLRLAGAPDKWQFAKRPLNIVDVLAILPYYLSLSLMDTTGGEPGHGDVSTANHGEAAEEEESSGLDEMSRIVLVFRIARILRIFKLARSSEGLQAIAHTMKTSYKELSLLLLFVGMGMLIFGTLAYFAEKDAVDTKYTSIPESMWWAIQTMTSVGYGDLYPVTIMGKLIGSCCGVSGILVMALPIPIVVENFGAYYMEQKKRAGLAAKRDELANVKEEQVEAGKFEMKQLANTLHQQKPVTHQHCNN